METHYHRIQALSLAARQRVDRQCRDWLAARPARDGLSAGPGQRSLAVFYVADDALPADEVRAFLEARLPAYVLPADYVQVETLPKTITGKIDRGALQHLRVEREPRVDRRAAAVATPLTEAEARMARIWRGVLNIAEIGADDNFFALGGHSLLATQVVMEIEQVFGRQVPLNTIFKHPTLGALCRHLEAERAPDAAAAIVEDAPPDDLPPLSHAQRRLWYASQVSDGGLDYKIVKVIELRGRLNDAALGQAMSEVARRHESLRTTFGYAAGSLVQKVQPPAAITIDHVDLGDLAPEAAERAYAGIEASVLDRPFDLEQGPVLRLMLVHYGDERTRVMFDVHHIAIDGWSFGILVRELNDLFQRWTAGLPAALPPLPAQYRHYVRWEQAHVGTAAQERHLAYWRRRLAGSPTLDLPCAHAEPRPAAVDGETAFTLGRDTSDAIKALGAAMALTPFMVLASAYFALLHTHAGACDLSIGTDVANRDTKEYASLIGFFVNQLVLRVQVTPDMPFTELCRRTSSCVEEAFEHKDVPYDRVVGALRPRTARERDPLFRAKLVLHQPMPDLAIEGITTSFVDVRPRMTKFDLLLNLEERAHGLIGKFEYRGALFDAAAIDRLIQRFTTLCASIARRPEATLAELRAEVETDERDRAARVRDEQQAARRRQLDTLLGSRRA